MTILCTALHGALSTQGGALYSLKELMKTAGWSVKASGDGLAAFSSSGDVITGPSTGAGGMANTNAWFRIQMPLVGGVRREILVHKVGASTQTVRYSYSAGFTSGGSATVPPTASDSVAVGTSITWMGSDLGHWYMGADNASPYGFWLAGCPNGNGSLGGGQGGMLLEPLFAGSGPPGDVDPYVLGVENVSSGNWNTAKISTLGIYSAWMNKGLPEATFKNVYGSQLRGTSTSPQYPGAAGTGVHTLRESMAPIYWNVMSPVSQPIGCKGQGTLMFWAGTQKFRGQRMSLSATGDRISFGSVTFPWDGSAVLL